MFLLRKPSEKLIRQFISNQREQPFSYLEVAATRTTPPAGYTIDHNRIRLGDGEDVYRRAVTGLQNWKHFDLGWVKIVPPETAVQVGAIVAVQARSFGLWSLNACRIVYVINEAPGMKAAFGFAYGTLADHVECGEERFTVEWHEDNSVWYDLYAFSRPQHRLVRFAYPYARKLQKRFAKDSLRLMLAASRV
jgi:uncharacterized protein (UPF0548 family)